MFAVRREILKELLADPKWSRIFDRAKTMKDIEGVVTEYCMKKGYKVKVLAK